LATRNSIRLWRPEDSPGIAGSLLEV
jgi:hypothetical protein